MEKTVVLKLVVSGFGEASRDLEFLTNETTKLNTQKQRLTTESKAAARAITAEEGSIEKLRAETALLRAEANKMQVVNEAQIKQRDQLTKKIADNTLKIREHDRAMSGSSTLVGEYEKGFSEAFGKIGTSIAAVGGVIAGLYTAFNTFTAVMNSTGASADRFAEIIEGVKQGFDRVKIAVATLDFKDFIKNVKAAIDEGQRYAAGLDEVDDKTRALRIAEAEGGVELLKQRQIQNSALKTIEERNAAGEEAIRIENDLARIRTEIADQAFKNELDNVASLANGTKDVTDAMRQEILLYIRRDEAFMKSLGPAESYRQKMEEINKLRAEAGGYDDQRLASSELSNKILEIEKTITEEEIRSNEILTRVTIPTDEKYTKLQERMVEVSAAQGSAMQNTMRIQTKFDATQNTINQKFAEGSMVIQDLTESLKYLAPAAELALAPLKSMAEDEEWEKGMEVAREAFRKNKEDQAKLGAEITAENKARDEEEKKSKREVYGAAIDGAKQAADAIFGGKRARLNAEMQAELNKENLTEAQRLAIKKKYAKEQQKIDVSQALANGAMAIIKNFATLGIPAAWFANALVAVQTAIQIGVIKAQKYASGGRVIGGIRVTPDSRGDDTVIVAKQGEAVINESQQQRLGGAAALKRAGVPGFADGGLIGSISYSPGLPFDVDSFVNRMVQGINAKEVVLNIHKLNSAESELSVITQTQRI